MITLGVAAVSTSAAVSSNSVLFNLVYLDVIHIIITLIK